MSERKVTDEPKANQKIELTEEELEKIIAGGGGFPPNSTCDPEYPEDCW